LQHCFFDMTAMQRCFLTWQRCNAIFDKIALSHCVFWQGSIATLFFDKTGLSHCNLLTRQCCRTAVFYEAAERNFLSGLLCRFLFLQHTKTGKNILSHEENIPKGNKIFRTAVKYTKWTLNIPTSSLARPSKIYPTLDFWFENAPSGNPAPYVCNCRTERLAKTKKPQKWNKRQSRWTRVATTAALKVLFKLFRYWL
jgi:hypothetical protein